MFFLHYTNSAAYVGSDIFPEWRFNQYLMKAHDMVANNAWDHAQIWYERSSMLAWDSASGLERIYATIDASPARLENNGWNWLDVYGYRHEEPKDERENQVKSE